MNNIDIDFEQLLLNGSSSYERQIASWWLDRAGDKAHQKAYRNIAEFMFAQLKFDGKADGSQEPKFLIDYACGGGHLIPHLMRLLPEWNIIGIDGSLELLQNIAHNHSAAKIIDAQQAFAKEGPQIRLVHSGLPSFSEFKAGQADAVLLCFPNLLPDNSLLDVFNENGYMNEKDNDIAHCLARFEEMDPHVRDGESENEEDRFDELMTARVFSRNFHYLLKESGCLLRVEYSNCHRDELSILTQWRSLFAEGALETSINDKSCEAFFTYDKSYYTPSPVILDVYHQTSDEGDKEGGYCVHFFKK